MNAVDLAPAARLLGRLLVRELDAPTLAEFAALAPALAAVGIEAPEPDRLEALASEFFTLLLRPPHGLPPVQSLWLEGRYDGEAAVAVRAIAAAAALESAPGARGAPPDHLGCILLLWAELAASRPDLAARLQREHFTWGERALRDVGARSGFYGGVGRAASQLLRELAVAGGDGCQ